MSLQPILDTTTPVGISINEFYNLLVLVRGYGAPASAARPRLHHWSASRLPSFPVSKPTGTDRILLSFVLDLPSPAQDQVDFVHFEQT
ncbi:hypothetical protein RSAG8_04122, partial [Rhizoctonia solani AG-8 WAC10335]